MYQFKCKQVKENYLSVIGNHFYLCIITLIIFVCLTSCSTATKEEAIPNPNTDEKINLPIVYNKWNTYINNGSIEDKVDIGIVFETKVTNDKQNEYLAYLDKLLESGDYSFFKNKVYKKHKSKMNVHYAFIPRSENKNTIAGKTEEETTAYFNEFREKSKEFFDKNPLSKKISSSAEFRKLLVDHLIEIGIKVAEFKPQLYACKRTYNSSDTSEKQKAIISKNLMPFEDLKKSSQYDFYILLSDGASPYADMEDKTAYTDYGDFVSHIIDTKNINDEFLTCIFTHELSHLFGNFIDEYYAFEPSERLPTEDRRVYNNIIYTDAIWKGVRFDPNIKSTSPWLADIVPIIKGRRENKQVIEVKGPVPNYNGEVFEGGSVGRSYRTQDQTIMGDAVRMSPSEWENGFSPVQEFVLDYFINEIVKK